MKESKKYSDSQKILGKKRPAQTREETKESNKKQKTEEGVNSKGAQPLMLAKNWDPVADDPKGWLMSEKLDGVRCFWNGRNMYTRNGNLFYPPDWFKEFLPKNLALDGELWTERDDFQKSVSIVRRQDKNEEWKQITYMVYDAPNLSKDFSERLTVIEKTLAQKPSKHVVFHKQVVCKDAEHLDQEMKKVIALKGEGLMIKDPKSKYEAKRSKFLLKVK